MGLLKLAALFIPQFITILSSSSVLVAQPSAFLSIFSHPY
jgi:hypothetical protein